ncbi:MAG: hypothetical protein RLZ05_8 [Bacteroidota bacterium]
MLLLGITALQAQSIIGKIKSSNGGAVEAVTVSVLNSDKITIADKQGMFSFPKMKAGVYQISFSSIGYATLLKEVTVSAEKTTELVITLYEQNQQLGEVVVTANKREEDILKVATSITSLSSKKVEDTRTWGLKDLTALVPNYSYQELGVASQQLQSIRGIQAFSENPAVSTYIDDVNNLDILANGFAFTDIERIEVLRGPQGTLFGRNSMGGVVNIITKKPANKASGFLEAGTGNQGLQRYAGGFKMPLVKDKLFFGLTGLFQTKDGYLKNDTTGTRATDGSVNGKLVGGEKNLYGNLFLKFLPSSRFSLTLNIKGQSDWSNNTGFMISQPSDVIAFANPDKVYLRRIGEHKRNIINNSLVAKYFGSNFTFTSISAYQNIRLGYSDVDFPGFYHTFYDKKVGELLPPQEVFSQELRISTNNSKKIQYTAGLYSFLQKGYEPTTNLVYELSAGEAAFYGLPAGSNIIYRNRSKNYGMAGFGELSYSFTNKLKGAVGLRYDYEKKQSTFNGFGDAALVGGTITDFVKDTIAKGNYSALSPKLSLSYLINEKSTIYISYNRGFRSGGINAQRFSATSGVKQTFDPEYSDNFELGYKTSVADNKVSLSASAFLIEWKDMQLYNLVAPFTYARENVGNAQSLGLEAEISAIPIKGLQLDGSVGLNKTKYRDFALTRVNYGTGVETKTQIGGNSLSNTPSHTIYIAAQYELSITKKLKAIVRGELRNIGKYYADMQNSLKQSAYTLINTRVGFTYNKYSLFFWGQNLTSEKYLLYGSSDTSFGRTVLMASPSTYGFTLSAKF